MPNVLGLEIGRSTIKAVLMARKGLGGGRILDARILDVRDSEGIGPALQKLAEDKNFAGIPCFVSVPSQDVLFRHVRLPFRDDNRIRKTLLFELEPLIPLPIENVIADYIALPREGLLVGAMPKETIREIIEQVEKNLGDVSVIDTSSSALAVQIPDHKKTSVSIILDIGRNATTAAFCENESVIHIRSLAFSGEQITLAMAKDFSVDRNRAEQLKISGDYPEAMEKTGEECRRLCSELKNTVEFMKINGVLHNDPAQILLTGGGALFGPLRKEIEKNFTCPVELLNLISARQLEVEKNIMMRMNPSLLNAAAANALRSSAGKKSFNFRQGEFTARPSHLNFKNHLRWAGILAAVILLLAVVNQILDYSLKMRQIGGIKKDIARIFQKSFPDAPSMVDPVQQLKTKIEEDKKTFGLGEGMPEATTADFLKELSALISPSLEIVFTALTYENRVISVKGEAKTVDDVTLIKDALAKSKSFKEVTMGPTSLTRDGGKVDFSLRIEVQ
ncbi:MAG TPA: pilus assembly protein PilM [Smithella sp.]|nr:pilus assembly protein PilM [Smithella sp.]